MCAVLVGRNATHVTASLSTASPDTSHHMMCTQILTAFRVYLVLCLVSFRITSLQLLHKNKLYLAAYVLFRILERTDFFKKMKYDHAS